MILPYFLVKMSRKILLDKWLSDIVICYAVGILLGNTKSIWLYSWSLEGMEQTDKLLLASAKEMAGIAVILAIPMLLMINNIKDWLSYTAKNTLVFLLFALCVASICYGVGFAFRDSIAEHDIAAGMMTGVYIGGTPNMVAISKALNAEESMFTLLNATDTFCSAVYLIFMLSFAKLLLRKILPVFKENAANILADDLKLKQDEIPFPPKVLNKKTLMPLLLGLLISIAAIGVSVIPAFLLPDANGEMNSTILILLLTTIGIALSFNARIRNLTGVFNFAQYLLLVFGLSTGFLADFGHMIAEGGQYLIFNAIILGSILIGHTLLAIIFRVDCDSFIICSCANVMGPPFIGQACAAIKNKTLIPVGISLGLLGLAIANYIGILISYLL
jgi:uncharacterized membrane protein